MNLNLFTVLCFTFILLAGIEFYRPWYKPKSTKLIRWLTYIGLFVFNTFILRALLPISIIVFAANIEQSQLGLFNFLELPIVIEIFLSIVILDLMNYLFHYLSHIYSPLWRLHRVHHADPDYDVTTHLCHHPLEVLVTTLFLFSIVTIFGISALAALIFSIVMEMNGLFIHTNIKIPQKLDRLLRFIIITPAMHRVHHSDEIGDLNSNFGAIFSWWDYVFKTYCSQPIAGYEAIQAGVKGFTSPKWILLPWLLIQPFYRDEIFHKMKK